MTGHPCSCETCTQKREVYTKPDYSNYTPEACMPYVRCLKNNEIIGGDEYNGICARGCLSHSQAMECLMKDVIERLTSAIKTCDNPEQESAYAYAIDIIKSGGK